MDVYLQLPDVTGASALLQHRVHTVCRASGSRTKEMGLWFWQVQPRSSRWEPQHEQRLDSDTSPSGGPTRECGQQHARSQSSVNCEGFPSFNKSGKLKWISPTQMKTLLPKFKQFGSFLLFAWFTRFWIYSFEKCEKRNVRLVSICIFRLLETIQLNFLKYRWK